MNMTMSALDAFNILGITKKSVTHEELEYAYQDAISQYYPGIYKRSAMMKLVLGAYKTLLALGDPIERGAGDCIPYGDWVNAALDGIAWLEVTIEVCGSWVWLSGTDEFDTEVLLMEGFRWCPEKQRWYFGPEGRTPHSHQTKW